MQNELTEKWIHTKALMVKYVNICSEQVRLGLVYVRAATLVTRTWLNTFNRRRGQSAKDVVKKGKYFSGKYSWFYWQALRWWVVERASGGDEKRSKSAGVFELRFSPCSMSKSLHKFMCYWGIEPSIFKSFWTRITPEFCEIRALKHQILNACTLNEP